MVSEAGIHTELLKQLSTSVSEHLEVLLSILFPGSQYPTRPLCTLILSSWYYINNLCSSDSVCTISPWIVQWLCSYQNLIVMICFLNFIASCHAVTKTVSVELGRKDNIACILLHPGTVDTDLSRPFQRNVPKDKLFTREFSVERLLSILDNVKKSDNGKFFAWDGQEIPWWLDITRFSLRNSCQWVNVAFSFDPTTLFF